MRIPHDPTSPARVVSFVAVDISDLRTRETGMTVGNISVHYSLDDGAVTAMVSPTITERDATNMPGVYSLKIDETGMTSLDAGKDTMELTLHIKDSGSVMHPVTMVHEIYRPETTEGNTLDVTSTGAGGIDWGNIENKTTANDLSGTDIQLADTVTTLTGHTAQTGDTYALANGATGFTAIDTVVDTINSNVGTNGAALTAITGVQLAADQAVNATKLGGAAVTATTSVTFPTASTVATTTGAVGSVTGAVGSVAGNVDGNVTGTVAGVTPAAAGAQMDLVNAPNSTAVTAITTDLLTSQMTESYAANGTAPTLAQAQFAIHQMLMQFGISGTSLTVRKLDDTTTAFVVTLDSASAPTDAKRI